MSMTHDEMIAVIAAHKDGKTIQIKGNISGEWNDADSPRFNFVQCTYRIKPEPLVLWGVYCGADLFYVTSKESDAKTAYTTVDDRRIKKFVEEGA